MKLTILYRGPLSSCNYHCPYCPFAKDRETEAEHAIDRQCLERFVRGVEGRPNDRLAVFFTPWGEALIQPRYQQALVQLSHMAHVTRTVIQTNLSCRLDWVEECDRQRLALWTTYHPGQVSRRRFLAQCRQLDHLGVRFSVGVVGMREHLEEIEAVRRELPAHIYLWVNAYKHGQDYYTAAHLQRLRAVDPLFPLNNTHHPSRGRPCRCGHTVISVDGQGTLRRCHFIRTALGNLYEPGFERALRQSPCSNETCGCHIGYVHMPELGLYKIFGEGVLERIPAVQL
jgi:MoaA/NifB/PqqE/SkfB family radical SAM enzyme